MIPAHSARDGICSCRDTDCGREGKHPRLGWYAAKERRAGEDEIRRWWKRWPDANLAVVTGSLSGLVVVDVDPRHGGDEALRAFEGFWGALPETARALTGGGGTHYLFGHPGGHVESGANLLPGVDVRADDGYIIAPPSSHLSGRTYEWDTAAHPDDIPLALLPPDLLDAMRSFAFKAYEGGVPDSRVPLDLDAIIVGMAKVPESVRNVVMAKVAGLLIHMNDEWTQAEVLMGALAINDRSFDPPLGVKEVETIVASILRRDKRQRTAKARAEEAMENMAARLDADNLPREDQLETAGAFWAEAGLPVLTDWYALVAGGDIEYIVVTPESEVEIGHDLLDYTTIRKSLFNTAGVLLPAAKKPDDWDRRALMLRKLCREEEVAVSRPSEVADEWVDDFIRATGIPEVSPESDQRREYIASQAIVIDGYVYLSSSRLAQFLSRGGERVTAAHVGRMLKRAKWEKHSLADGMGSSIRAWRREWA